MGPGQRLQKKLWVLAAVPEECREFISARHSPGLARLGKRLSEPQPPSPYPGLKVGYSPGTAPRVQRALSPHRPGLPGVSALSTLPVQLSFLNALLPEEPGFLS